MVRRGSSLAWSEMVLPTRVGMVRWPDSGRHGANVLPHAAWGWSGPAGPEAGRRRVLPTRAGGDGPRSGCWLLFCTRVCPTRIGDGPANRADATAAIERFSPCAWGWSVQPGRGEFLGRVSHARGDGPTIEPQRFIRRGFSPMRVGMVRYSSVLRDGSGGSPRRAWGWSGPGCDCSEPRAFSPRRGDGPDGSHRCPVPAFSPRAWGWSASRRPLTASGGVLPHARGDGPDASATCRIADRSPRTRVGMVRAVARALASRVLPTRVGMVRIAIAGRRMRQFSPRRGDGPPGAAPTRGVTRFSPRAWGWSARCLAWIEPEPGFSPQARGDGPRHGAHGQRHVLPTRVGMVRKTTTILHVGSGSPHARGDGPRSQAHHALPGFSPRAWGWSAIVDPPSLVRAFSPRAWGWSANAAITRQRSWSSPHARGDGPIRRLRLDSQQVLPTRVGMVRMHGPRLAHGSPHARGDGPQCSVYAWLMEFSPRAWGWSEAHRGSRGVSGSPHARGDGPHARQAWSRL